MNCKRCEKYIGEYAGRGRPPKYCKSCAYTKHLKDMADLVASKRKYFKELGTTNISSEMSKSEDNEPNFKKEASIVKKELKKLGLRK